MPIPAKTMLAVHDPDTSLLLDNGVTGIVFPDISTVAEARRAVNRAKFPPIGKRSVSGSYPIFDYRAVAMADAVKALNDNTLVVCMTWLFTESSATPRRAARASATAI